MNCRQIQRILPELASGEIEERIAAQAHAHMASCSACASEYAGYQAAMCALAQPRESVEVPSALDVLLLPEPKRGWSWARPVLVTAALAAVLAGIVLMPRTQEPATRSQVAVNLPRMRAVLPKATAPVRPLVAELPKKRAESPVRIVPHMRRVPHNMVALADTSTINRPAVSAVLGLKRGEEYFGRDAGKMKFVEPASALTPDRASDASEAELARDDISAYVPQGSVIVMASDIEDQAQPDVPAPTEISITSTDESTGSTAVYEYSRDSEGREQFIETKSSKPLGI